MSVNNNYYSANVVQYIIFTKPIKTKQINLFDPFIKYTSEKIIYSDSTYINAIFSSITINIDKNDISESPKTSTVDRGVHTGGGTH